MAAVVQISSPQEKTKFQFIHTVSRGSGFAAASYRLALIGQTPASTVIVHTHPLGRDWAVGKHTRHTHLHV